MPHPANWQTVHGKTAAQGKVQCSRCHAPSFCTSCHGLAMPHPDNWLDAHGKTVEKQPTLCAKCHGSKDCLQCHEGNPPPTHDKSWGQQHPVVGGKSPSLCQYCHSAAQGTTCLTCHGLPMPHPDDFATQHSKIASFDKNAVCFRCHQLKKDCGECHDVAKN
jgi:hypothetical protein